MEKMTPAAIARAKKAIRALYVGKYDTLKIRKVDYCLFEMTGAWTKGEMAGGEDKALYATRKNGAIF